VYGDEGVTGEELIDDDDVLVRRWEKGFCIEGDPSNATCLSVVKDVVERGRLAVADDAPDEPEVERLSLPKFGT